MKYEPTLESVRRHPVPDWFHDAKLGIFIHWGLYSVPAWAPLGGELNQVIAKEGWIGWFARNPYAEWYMNSMRITGSPTQQYHAKTYGPDFAYQDFVPLFNQAIQGWNPTIWADLFRQAGARYVVLTAKHHDGFLLWPSQHPNPFYRNYHAQRDLIGELTEAVCAQGLKIGLYYSGGIDWTFNDLVIRDLVDLFAAIPQSDDYVAYANAHWHELIDRYRPSVMWNDIGYPARANLPELFSYYYNAVADGVINDRFIQLEIPANRLIRALLKLIMPWLMRLFIKRGVRMPTAAHFDFRTPEYTSYDHVVEFKWEATRGMGYSFGYNRNESPDHYLSVQELIRSFVDMVSKNGNLLLNVGPTAEGVIPEIQRERLIGLGNWLSVNGESIYGTRPGPIQGLDWCRSTVRGNRVYLHVFDWPAGGRLVVPGPLRVGGAYLLSDPTRRPLSVQTTSNETILAGPAQPPDPVDNVIVLMCAQVHNWTRDASNWIKL